MKKRYISALIVMLAFFLQSCEKDADIEVPKVDPRMVLSCFVSPDQETIKAVLRVSDPVFGSGNNVDPYMPLEGATITLRHGNGAGINMTYDMISGTYTLPGSAFPIELGETYTIIASHPDYATISATTTVPASNPQIDEFTVLDVDTVFTNFDSYIDYSLKARWRLTSGIGQYYILQFDNRIQYDDGSGIIYTQLDYLGSTFIQNSDNEASFNRTYQLQGSYFMAEPGLDSELVLTVVNASEEYYRFHKSIQNINYGDPFSEPTLIYDNVENGLGIFAAFTKKES